ncbi:HlyD family efflux transporter periplasmic adaptor subunit [Novosphingobium sp.]|uniref:HlyD family efflux transporter periplasmic adaptor subunit n=1 Tax=Novosphingobium sp. TaxID=1874826 RepID=UPI0038BD48E6
MTLPSHSRARQAIGAGLTGVLVLVAIWAGLALFNYYQDDPWTRDGRIRADVVRVAADVSGLVTAVHFDHDQPVHKGDVLFEIDPSRYRIALTEAETGVRQAEADLAAARAGLAGAQARVSEARREAVRNRGLGELVASETTEQSESKAREGVAAAAEAGAAIAQAEARLSAAHDAVDLARLNLARTKVVAPVDGTLSDVALRVGNYVSAGSPVMALVDTSSLRVEGYFEETKLPNIRIGQRATIRVMGEDKPLHGHVIAIAAAIEDHDRKAGSNLLPEVNPSFSWVRLPQRVPVRIRLDAPPREVALIAGRTVSVALDMAKGDSVRKEKAK